MILTLSGVYFTVSNLSARHLLAGDIDPSGFTTLNSESILAVYCTGAIFYLMLPDVIVQFECVDRYIFCPGVLDCPINFCVDAPNFQSAALYAPSSSAPLEFMAPAMASPRLCMKSTLRPQSSVHPGPQSRHVKPALDDFGGNIVTSYRQNTFAGSPFPCYTRASALTCRLESEAESRGSSTGSEYTVGSLSIPTWDPLDYESNCESDFEEPFPLHKLQSELEPSLLAQIERNIRA